MPLIKSMLTRTVILSEFFINSYNEYIYYQGYQFYSYQTGQLFIRMLYYII